MWQVGDKLGRFRLDREIGQGSHGVVWIATDTALDTPVAVKILHPWLTQDTAVRDRFKRELLLARRIAHPGICRLFDLHEEGDAFFITMDYVEGQTLLNILKNEGRLLPGRGTKILRGVCQALAAAHAAGVIHRDLKPANIIVRSGDVPMILDFGTATAQDVSRVTRPGTAVGSMRFIAPEVFTGIAPSIRTDIYSLGVVAYVTFAGKLPYNAAAGAIEMLEMIRNQPPQRIDIIQPDVPPLLADIVNRAMEKNPDNRFANALAFDEALAEVENMLEPTMAKPKSTSSAPDFARWAPSQVIRDSVSKTGSQQPVKLTSQLAEAPPTVTNATQAAQTVVDVPRPSPGDLSLGTHIPSNASGDDLPVVTGKDTGQVSPAIVEAAANASEQGLEAAFDNVLPEPKTDEGPRPTISVPTDPSAENAPTDTVEEPRAISFPPAAPDSVMPRMEPTVRIANFHFEEAEKAALSKGFDKRLLAAGAVVVIAIVGAVIGFASKSGDGKADAGIAPVVAAAVDAGEAPKVVDAGSAAVVAKATDAGEAATNEGEGMVFGEDAGLEEPTKGETGGGHPVPVLRPHGDPRVDDQIRQVRAAMAKKGLIGADLPQVNADLDKAHTANAHGKPKDAEKLVESAKSAVDAQQVDRTFVMTKIGRFNKAFDKSKRPDIADKVDPLTKKAGAAFASGNYDAANRALNSAFALVAKPK